jgi:hypothetical protein
MSDEERNRLQARIAQERDTWRTNAHEALNNGLARVAELEVLTRQNARLMERNELLRAENQRLHDVIQKHMARVEARDEKRRDDRLVISSTHANEVAKAIGWRELWKRFIIDRPVK